MSTSLHTGKVYHIDYTPCGQGMFGSDGQQALYNIFSMFDIAHSANDDSDDDYEVKRSELERLRAILTKEDETYLAHAEKFHEELHRSRTSKENFMDVLNHLIDASDQSNEWVLISWF